MNQNIKDAVQKSQRGKEKIEYDGYTYNFTIEKGGQKIWRCNKKTTKSCTSRLITFKIYVFIIFYHITMIPTTIREKTLQ